MSQTQNISSQDSQNHFESLDSPQVRQLLFVLVLVNLLSVSFCSDPFVFGEAELRLDTDRRL